MTFGMSTAHVFLFFLRIAMHFGMHPCPALLLHNYFLRAMFWLLDCKYKGGFGLMLVVMRDSRRSTPSENSNNWLNRMGWAAQPCKVSGGSPLHLASQPK